MKGVNGTYFFADGNDYQSKKSAQSYLCPDYTVQATAEVAPMECYPED